MAHSGGDAQQEIRGEGALGVRKSWVVAAVTDRRGVQRVGNRARAEPGGLGPGRERWGEEQGVRQQGGGVVKWGNQGAEVGGKGPVEVEGSEPGSGEVTSQGSHSGDRRNVGLPCWGKLSLLPGVGFVLFSVMQEA